MPAAGELYVVATAIGRKGFYVFDKSWKQFEVHERLFALDSWWFLLWVAEFVTLPPDKVVQRCQSHVE